MAINCLVNPFATIAFAGVTAIETSIGSTTVNVAAPKMLPEAALIVAVPAATPEARPKVVADIVATPGLNEVQVS